MSGGHYEYAYCQINDLADHIKDDIDNNQVSDEYGFSYNFSEETMTNMKKLHSMLLLASKLSKEAEWLYSGDTGEDTFNNEFKNIL